MDKASFLSPFNNSYCYLTIFILEMGLEPVPLQLQHVATNRSQNHHSTNINNTKSVTISTNRLVINAAEKISEKILLIQKIWCLAS